MIYSVTADRERKYMSKYTEEFRRDAIELMKKIGITKAAKELKVSHGTIYRWCREMESISANEPEETTSTDLDMLIEEHVKAEEHSPEPSVQKQTKSEDEAREDNDAIAMAMALLVIENTHLREVIHHLRDTISGLTDHNLL